MASQSKQQFLQLLGSNCITKICWALVLIVLMHRLGKFDFGVLATLWSVAGIAAGFADLGMSQVVLREGSREPGIARLLAWYAFRVQLVLNVILLAVLAAGMWWLLPDLNYAPFERAFVIILSLATPLVDRIQSLFTVCSQIGGNYKVYARGRSGYFAILLLALAWVVLVDGGLVTVCLVYFGVTVLFAFLLGFGTWKLLPPHNNNSEIPPFGGLVLQGTPFLLITILTLIYGRVEVAILGVFGLTSTAGAYHLIYQLVLLIYSVSGLFFTVVYPRLYRHKGDNVALTADFRDTVRWLSLLAWLTAPALWLFAEPVLTLLGGLELADNTLLLQTLSFMILILPSASALNFLLPADMLPTRVVCDFSGILVTAILAAGAAALNQPDWVAIAAVLGYAVANIIAQFTLSRKLQGLSWILSEEFSRIGYRMLPAILLTGVFIGNEWLGALIFLTTSAVSLLTHRPLVNRIRNLLLQTKPQEIL